MWELFSSLNVYIEERNALIIECEINDVIFLTSLFINGDQKPYSEFKVEESIKDYLNVCLIQWFETNSDIPKVLYYKKGHINDTMIKILYNRISNILQLNSYTSEKKKFTNPIPSICIDHNPLTLKNIINKICITHPWNETFQCKYRLSPCLIG